jgi:hypothetical protein
MPIAAIAGGLNAFQNHLIGTWSNQALPNATEMEGSTANPLSYNVMPLPQTTGGVEGFILKNSTIYEVVKFNSISDIDLPTTAANRGEGLLQTPTALYYEQQVFFGAGPKVGTVVHTENGSWLNLTTSDAFTGANPYQDPVLQKTNQQPANHTIAKQMSVPHGNSILALGAFFQPVAGMPKIVAPGGPLPYLPCPKGLDISAYSTVLDQHDAYQNPIPPWTKDPLKPLNLGVKLIKPTHSIHWAVTTTQLPDPSAKGGTLNIPFEQRLAEVTDYGAIYWLLSTDGGHSYPYLAYAQAITLCIEINEKHYSFPHLTSNLITKQGG